MVVKGERFDVANPFNLGLIQEELRTSPLGVVYFNVAQSKLYSAYGDVPAGTPVLVLNLLGAVLLAERTR